MVELKDIFKFQKEFDEKHGWIWDHADPEKRSNMLKLGALALAGEAGEFANLVKKVWRQLDHDGTGPSAEMVKKLQEEIVDVFIYVVTLSENLNLDLEKGYFDKMKFNNERFQKFEKGKDETTA